MSRVIFYTNTRVLKDAHEQLKLVTNLGIKDASAHRANSYPKRMDLASSSNPSTQAEYAPPPFFDNTTWVPR